MNHIEYPERYAAAIKRNIINNAMKTFHRTVEDAKDIINWCDENAYRNEFAAALCDAYWNYGKLTEKQCEAVRKCLARKAEWAAERKAKREAERANAEDVPEGRTEVTGVIVGSKIVDGHYGETRKVTVKDDRGFVVYGTLANALEEKIIDDFYEKEYAKDKNAKIKFVGVRVTFAAALTPANDDPKFGFFKRPTKAKIIETEEEEK